MMLKMKCFVVSALLLTGCFVSFPTKLVLGVQNQLRIEPSTLDFYSNVTALGDVFKICIIAEVDASTPFYGWELLLSWTPHVVDCVGEEFNYGIWGADNFLGPWVSAPIDNSAGTYHQSLTGKSPGEPASGTFCLVNLTYEIADAPWHEGVVTTEFHLQRALGYDAYCLLDSNSTEIPHEYADGTYNYYWSPPLVRPHLEVFPQVNATRIRYSQTSTTFDVDIMIRDVDLGWQVLGVELLLFYNNTFLNVVGTSYGDFFERFGIHPFYYFEVSSELGRVRIAALPLELGGWDTHGDGRIATLTFNASYDLQLYPSILQSYLNITVDTEYSSSYFLDRRGKEVAYDPAIGGLIELQLRMPGDVNIDGIVNAEDAVLLGLAFASKPDSHNWNESADENLDGYINAKDVVLVGQNFGKTYP
jgi:hypothetical protein